MIALPKLVLLLLVAFAVWYAMRWLNRAPTKIVRRREAQSPQPAMNLRPLGGAMATKGSAVNTQPGKSSTVPSPVRLKDNLPAQQ